MPERADGGAEIVDVGRATAAVTPGTLWDPISGEESEQYLASLPADARGRIGDEARAILARSSDPHGYATRRAGLIVGMVQSGKTTSMAACAAMARDNGFGLIVLVAGTSTILLEQSRARVAAALRLNESDVYRRWEHFASPTLEGRDADRIVAALEARARGSFAGDEPTVLITVMKQSKHLQDLVAVLERVAATYPLASVPSLIFDDEADQATPNLNRDPGEESATYRDLRRIRATLPWHTLLQYTATPQALLLIDIADEISPDFTCILEPGSDYVGGKYFFEEHRDDYVRTIPDTDLAAADPDASDPPRSLQDALALYLVGTTAAKIRRDHRPAQRSMLIHPSQQVAPHKNFVRWTRAILQSWKQTLALDAHDPDRGELITDLIAPAYRDLAGTVDGLPSLDEICRYLPAVISRLRLEEVNASNRSKAPTINWSQAYAWILVGGTLMDRGFTVEGLCVTYMPRGVGVGNADTLQQRARFFGYKRPYAGYCRAWIEPVVAEAFSVYVEHEESVRAELVRATRDGMSLRDWRRNFILDPALQPTRRQVIRLPYDRPVLNGWQTQTYLAAPDSDLNESNAATVRSFLGRVALDYPAGLDPRLTKATRHKVGATTVGALMNLLFEPYHFYGGSSAPFRGLQLLLGSVDPGERVKVYLMGAGEPREHALEKGKPRIANLMQGRNPKDGPAIYPGDREMKEPDHLTVQIHWVRLLDEDRTLLQESVPALAVWVPDRLATAMLVGR